MNFVTILAIYHTEGKKAGAVLLEADETEVVPRAYPRTPLTTIDPST